MIYLKDTSSPQEYDQAIFRLQNQYVKEYVSEDGDIIKYNIKKNYTWFKGDVVDLAKFYKEVSQPSIVRLNYRIF